MRHIDHETLPVNGDLMMPGRTEVIDPGAVGGHRHGAVAVYGRLDRQLGYADLDDRDGLVAHLPMQTETTNAVGVVEDGAKRTHDGVVVVEQAREAFLSIGQAVEDMDGRIAQIAAAAQQMSASATSMQSSVGEVAAVAEQSSASTEEVSASSEETSASAQQIAASSHELAENAEALNALVAQFKLAA